MLPHNDHWQLTQMLVWKVLQATVGLQSHLPYLLPTLLAHVGAAIAVYVLARRQAGPFIAFAVGVLFLLLGTAGEVFFFAAAFNLVAATALGAWALVVALPADPLSPVGRRRSTAVAVLLLVAVMSGGPGLFYLPAVAVVALLVPGRRRELWVVLPAALAFVGWSLPMAAAPRPRRRWATCPRCEPSETTSAPAWPTPWGRSPGSRTRSACPGRRAARGDRLAPPGAPSPPRGRGGGRRGPGRRPSR